MHNISNVDCRLSSSILVPFKEFQENADLLSNISKIQETLKYMQRFTLLKRRLSAQLEGLNYPSTAQTLVDLGTLCHVMDSLAEKLMALKSLASIDRIQKELKWITQIRDRLRKEASELMLAVPTYILL